MDRVSQLADCWHQDLSFFRGDLPKAVLRWFFWEWSRCDALASTRRSAEDHAGTGQSLVSVALPLRRGPVPKLANSNWKKRGLSMFVLDNAGQRLVDNLQH